MKKKRIISMIDGPGLIKTEDGRKTWVEHVTAQPLGDVSIPALCPLSSPFVEPARAAVQRGRLKWLLKKGHNAYVLIQMAARQPSAQVSRQQTAASKPPGELPEVPSSPKALSQMSAGRLSLRESLIAKLLRKYSPQVANNKTDAYIVEVVDNLIRQPKISEADLDMAEKKIRGFSHFEVEDILLMPFKNIAAKRAGLEDEWAVVNVVAKQNAERINKEKEDKKKTQKIDFRSGLEVQFKVHEKVHEEKKHNKEHDFVDICQKQKQYMAEQVKKMETESKKKLEERQMREAEMEEVKKKREAIRQAELDEQKAELLRLRGIMQEEMKNAARKKLEQADKLNAWKEENETNKKVKEANDAKIKKDEIKLAKAAIAAMEKQERARIIALADLKERMKGKEALALEQGKKMAEIAAEDERKAIEIQRKKKAEDEAIFKKAQELKERKKIELITALEEQSKIQHQRKIEEKKYMDEQAIMFKRSTLEGFAKDLAKEAERKRKLLEHRYNLEDQIRVRVKERGRDALIMTEMEKKLNRKFIDQAAASAKEVDSSPKPYKPSKPF